MDEHIEAYLLSTIKNPKPWVLEMEQYAREHRVPIMEPLGIELLQQIIRLKKPKKILEIGTAIGYSTLRMLEANPTSHITTIERDEERYKVAQQYVNAQDTDNRISLLRGDALETVDRAKENGPYDLLFIDAAKGQYQVFFDQYSELLTEEGIVISDNVLFKGLVAKQTGENKRLDKIAQKIKRYNEYLVNHPRYKTTIIPVGDGVAISVRKNVSE
ncbi:O-methyltransferase [Radiobacillus deserti]|uniref:tRNA 5-hydroxyuridine methyltransferase n=1 Tax=Radiobacillus deserti TaxID=2594883 RepID=A0A516KH14_9BACI|nr:O-methyltransferase [Radiobacillus deserti]QDP40691.1 O-methyltransferase [Radiobacillus deserti]